MRSLYLAVVLLYLNFLPGSAQITFSEVMFDPASSEYHDEFIEVFNLSYQDSIIINGWFLSDGSGSDTLITLSGGEKIAPRSYMLILDGSYPDNSTSYDSIIVDSLPVFIVGDNSIGQGGLANSKGEMLSITDSYGDTLTAYLYSTDNRPGYSDEKMVLDQENSTDNWANASVFGGTPGYRNSVLLAEYDIALSKESLQIQPMVFEGEEIKISVKVINSGWRPFNRQIKLKLYLDTNKDYSLQKNDRVIDSLQFFLADEDSQFLYLGADGFAAGEYLLGAAVYSEKDQYSHNNTAFRKLTVLSRQGDVFVNEIRFLTSEGEAEWVELINGSNNNIYLRNWCIADAVDTVAIDSPVYLAPGQMKLLCERESNIGQSVAESLVIRLQQMPNLNNGGDEIGLIQPDGALKEKVNYKPDWLEERIIYIPSLERINPFLASENQQNWGPSVDAAKSTPGRRNSIYSILGKNGSRLTVQPNPFTPDADGVEDVAVISGELPERSARIRVKIFDINGRLIRTLKENAFSGSRFNLIWDGKDNQGRRARIGIYIVYMMALNDWQGIQRELKTTVVLSGRL